MRPPRLFIASILTSLATFAHAQDPGPAEPYLPQIAATCTQAKLAHLPSDIAAAGTPAKYPKCDSYALYDKSIFAAARACAIRERAALLTRRDDSPNTAHPKPAPGSIPDQFRDTPAGGLIVLAELYANGERVPANPALATRFFCEAIDSHEIEQSINDADAKSVLATLDFLRNRKSTTPRLVFCDAAGQHADDRPTTRECNELAEEAHAEMHYGGIIEADKDAEDQRTEAYKSLQAALKNLNPTQRAAYTLLHHAYEAFAAVNVTSGDLYLPSYNPGGLSLTGPAGYKKNNLDTIFFITAAQAAITKAPAQITDFQQSDAALNAVWQKLLDTETNGHTPDAIAQLRTEQRAWLRYRDAFAAFGKTLNPAVPHEQWIIALTQDRATDLTAVNAFEHSTSR